MDKEKINSIFKEPGNYGVRGNHYLWIEFKERFEKEDIKSSLEFKNFLLENFKKLTGKSIMKSETYNIENNKTSGMSSNIVECDYWIEFGFPTLIYRFEKTIKNKSYFFRKFLHLKDILKKIYLKKKNRN